MTIKQLEAIKEMYLVDSTTSVEVDGLTIFGWTLYDEEGSIVNLDSLGNDDILNAFKAEFDLV